MIGKVLSKEEKDDEFKRNRNNFYNDSLEKYYSKMKFNHVIVFRNINIGLLNVETFELTTYKTHEENTGEASQVVSRVTIDELNSQRYPFEYIKDIFRKHLDELSMQSHYVRRMFEEGV